MKATSTHSWKPPSNTSQTHVCVTHFLLHGFGTARAVPGSLGSAGARDAQIQLSLCLLGGLQGSLFPIPSMGLAEASDLRALQLVSAVTAF